MDAICKKCGDYPRLNAVCELRAMPGMDKRCALTGKIVDADKDQK